MKKIVLMAAAIVAVSFASCGNKAANAEATEADSTTVVAVEEVAAQDSCCAAQDSCCAAQDSCCAKAE